MRRLGGPHDRLGRGRGAGGGRPSPLFSAGRQGLVSELGLLGLFLTVPSFLIGVSQCFVGKNSL